MADVEGGMDRWKESWELSRSMFEEVGIQYEFSDYESDK
jgi:hypothetical protein